MDIRQLLDQAAQWHQSEQWPQALAIYDQLLRDKPQWADIVHLKGALLSEKNPSSPLALECLRRSVVLDPHRGVFWANLALALGRQGEREEAVSAWRQAYRFGAQVEAVVAWAEALAELGRFSEAVTLLRYGHQRHGPHVGLLYGLSRFCYYSAQWEEADHWVQQLLALDPDFAPGHFVAASIWLGLGRYAEGFAAMEWRWRGAGAEGQRLFRNYPQPLWTPNQPPQRVLLWAEQGLGDSLNFIRFAPELAARSRSLQVWVPPSLERLFRHSLPQLNFTSGQQLAPFDSHLPFISLGQGLALKPHKLWSGPYLKAPPRRGFAAQLAAHQHQFKVGICWSGNRYGTTAEGAEAMRRNTRLGEWAPLAKLKGVLWVSLQKGDGLEDAEHSPLPLWRADDQLEDFGDTVELIEALDLVICVDSAVAHAAAGSGRPVWMLARTGGDWRWGTEATTTPWYPTLRVFHQRLPLLWRPTLEEIAEELAMKNRLIAGSSSES